MPPKKVLKKSSLKFSFFGAQKFFLKKKGNKRKILIKFRKKACSMGCMYAELNFINAAKTEKKKHEIIISVTGYILI